MTEEPLQRRKIANALAGQEVGSEVQVHEEVVSTSDVVRALGVGGFPHGLAVFAESQSGGRGRRGSRWESAGRKDLLLSVLLVPGAPREDWGKITPLAALAVCRTIATTTGLEAEIKWPNDVFLGGKKVAGVLAETVSRPGTPGAFIALGIGLNVNSSGEDFSPELRGEATSLLIETGVGDGRVRLDRNEVAIALLRHLNAVLPHCGVGFAIAGEEIKRRSFLLGKAVELEVDGKALSGLAEDLTEDGHLVLRMGDGERRVCASANLVRVRE